MPAAIIGIVPFFSFNPLTNVSDTELTFTATSGWVFIGPLLPILIGFIAICILSSVDFYISVGLEIMDKISRTCIFLSGGVLILGTIIGAGFALLSPGHFADLESKAKIMGSEYATVVIDDEEFFNSTINVEFSSPEMKRFLMGNYRKTDNNFEILWDKFNAQREAEASNEALAERIEKLEKELEESKS